MPGTWLESVTVSLLVLSNHWDTLFCGEGRERKPAGKEESLKDKCVCVCVRACSVAQSRPTLWDPMDCSMPGFPLEKGMANHASILAVRTP